jgi:hypothetical protein
MQHWRREIERFTGTPLDDDLIAVEAAEIVVYLPLNDFNLHTCTQKKIIADMYPVVYHGDVDDKTTIREFEWDVYANVCVAHAPWPNKLSFVDYLFLISQVSCT